MSSRQIPVYTQKYINLPAVKVNISQIENQVYVSSYTWNILPGHPSFSTLIDVLTGKKQLIMMEFWCEEASPILNKNI